MSEIINLDNITELTDQLVEIPEDLKIIESEPLDDLEESDDNPSDVLAKYINIAVEPYKGTVIDPQDVVNMYNSRCADWNRRLGRNTSLTAERFLQILELKELYSFTDERIAQAIGVSTDNLRRWKKRGRLSKDHAKYDQYFALFDWAYTKASTMMEKRLVGYVDAAAGAKWEAAKWLLSKTEQSRYGDFTRSEVDVKSENVNTNVDVHISLTEADKQFITPMLENFIKRPVVIDNDES